jgi:hypothetical protein
MIFVPPMTASGHPGGPIVKKEDGGSKLEDSRKERYGKALSND